MLSNTTILAFAAAACLTRPCTADPVSETLERLRHLAKLPRLSSELKARVIASLPKEGEVRNLSAVQRQKISALAPVLRVHLRDTDYVIKVIESPQARLGIYARAVLLITGKQPEERRLVKSRLPPVAQFATRRSRFLRSPRCD